MTHRLPAFCLAMMLLGVSASGIGVSASGEIPEGMSQTRLEKTVKRRFDYIDKRLLSGKSARTIEESGNRQAIEILNQSRRRRDEIADLIAREEFQEAYRGLQELAHRLKDALQLARARQRGAKKLKDDMESARVVNDAYFELVRKRGISSAADDVGELLRQARQARSNADELLEKSDYDAARKQFVISTDLLKKAASLFRGRKR